MNSHFQANQSKFDLSAHDVSIILDQLNRKGSQQEQRALCCLLGSYAGDNLGNYNEFWNQISEEDLNEAMQMNGKGVHSLVSGQSTDDTELATSLGYGLIESLQQGVINLDMIAKYYGIWIKSEPFDIGRTTLNALKPMKNENLQIQLPYENYIYNQLSLKLKQSAFKNNKESKSNGGLMRVAPLCVYLSKVCDQGQIKQAVYEEQSLTHSNETSLECSYIFVRACIQLIQTGNASLTFETINDYVKNSCKVEDIKEHWMQNVLPRIYTKTIESEGFVIHAFTSSFIILQSLADLEKSHQNLNRSIIYKNYIQIILKLCGDSDTNAAICGAMLGSYLQISDFPTDYLNKIINCNLQDTSQPLLRNPRQPIYNPRNCIYLCQKLLEFGPSPTKAVFVYPQYFDYQDIILKLPQLKDNNPQPEIQSIIVNKIRSNSSMPQIPYKTLQYAGGQQIFQQYNNLNIQGMQLQNQSSNSQMLAPAHQLQSQFQQPFNNNNMNINQTQINEVQVKSIYYPKQETHDQCSVSDQYKSSISKSQFLFKPQVNKQAQSCISQLTGFQQIQQISNLTQNTSSISNQNNNTNQLDHSCINPNVNNKSQLLNQLVSYQNENSQLLNSCSHNNSKQMQTQNNQQFQNLSQQNNIQIDVSFKQLQYFENNNEKEEQINMKESANFNYEKQEKSINTNTQKQENQQLSNYQKNTFKLIMNNKNDSQTQQLNKYNNQIQNINQNQINYSQNIQQKQIPPINNSITKINAHQQSLPKQQQASPTPQQRLRQFDFSKERVPKNESTCLIPQFQRSLNNK